MSGEEVVVANRLIGKLSPPSTVDLFVSIVVSFNLALAQPVLELIGNNPEFFVARDSPRSAIVLVALAWTIGFPLVLGFLAYAGTKLHPYVGYGVHALFLTVIVAVLFIQVLERIPLIQDASGGALIASGVLIGVSATLAFFVFSGARSTLRIGAVVPILVLGLFLFVAPVSNVIFPESIAAPQETGGSSDVPVVAIVFDELPLSSLMDQRGRIDGRLFPHFAQFANGATWFRNTTTVAALTAEALPALLDGRYPREGSIPILSEHPDNLFTFMGGSHEVIAFEPITSLCPVEVCEPEPPEDPASRFDSLAEGLSIIASHVALPDDLTQGLPPIDQQWGNFAQQSSAMQQDFSPTELKPERYAQLRDGDPRLDYRRFLRSIGPSAGKRLYFFHSLLPHNPWRFLPSGQQYPQTEPIPGLVESEEGRAWSGDDWLLTQAWQRHLLQVGYVDSLLGRIIQRLKSAELYDRALIVVVSDHGTSFETGHLRRGLTPETIGHLAAVPLLVKEPGQTKGRIDDGPAQTIDVFPTILDVAGIDPPPGADGRSLFDTSAPRLKEKRFGWEGVTFPATGDEKFEVVERKYEAFSATGGPLDPFRIGPEATGDLVGQRLSRLQLGFEAPGSVSIDRPGLYEQADPLADPFPALISGTVRSDRLVTGEMILAISVNGRIAAVTRTYDRSGDQASFYAMSSPSFFSDSGNKLRVFVVDTESSPRSLQPIAGP
jgi:hypothetical protein